jgi:hypothetical protein
MRNVLWLGHSWTTVDLRTTGGTVFQLLPLMNLLCLLGKGQSDQAWGNNSDNHFGLRYKQSELRWQILRGIQRNANCLVPGGLGIWGGGVVDL